MSAIDPSLVVLPPGWRRGGRRLCDDGAVELRFAGAVLDVAVTELERSEAFYAILLGRQPDLRPQPDQREWRLHRDPEVAFRITAEPLSAGHGKLALGVADIIAERARLGQRWTDLPDPTVKPNVIALLRLRDPDGNQVTLWQDLLTSRST